MGSDYSGSTAKYTSKEGASLEFNFTGEGIKIVGPMNSYKGMAKVTIDGKVYSAVDMYSESPKKQAVLFKVSGLSSGKHSIKVEYTGMYNNQSKGSLISVDAFDIVEGNII